MVDYKRLGERIAQTRKSQKLSQEKLAELADITATNLSHIERGKIKTSIETLVAIANALITAFAAVSRCASKTAVSNRFHAVRWLFLSSRILSAIMAMNSEFVGLPRRLWIV